MKPLLVTLALCIAIPYPAIADSYTLRCKREGRHVYCVQKPYDSRSKKVKRRYPWPPKPRRDRR